MVSYANVEQGAFSAMTPGVSTPTELRLTLTKGAEYATCDALFHGMGRFLVKRGEARITTVALDKLFYRLDLSVTGAEQVEDFRVTFCGAPSGIDYAGAAVNEPVTYCPPLQHTGEGVLGGTLRIPRFADSHAVTMTLLSGERLLAQMALSEYLAQNGNHIDLTAKDEVIPIDIMVNTSDVTVTVNDWDEGAVQLPIVGH